MTLQTNTINVATSLMIAGNEVLNASGDITSNLIQGANDGTGIIVGHAPIGVNTGSTLQLVSLTTTERNNLVGTNGMLIWNETLGQVESYNFGWSSVSGGAGDLQSAYAGGNIIVTDVTNGAFDISGTQTISLDAQAASNFTVTGSGIGLTLEATGGGAGQQVVINSAGTGIAAVDVNATAGGVDIDAVTGFAIDATNAASSNLTCTNTTASTNTILTVSCVNTGAVAGNATLNIDASSTNGTAAIDVGSTNTDTVNIGNASASVVQLIGTTIDANSTASGGGNGIVRASQFIGGVAAVASAAIDLNGASLQTRTTSGATAFSVINQEASRAKTVTFIVTALGADIIPSFPVGWFWSGAEPTLLTNGVTAMLIVTSRGTADADVIASWAEITT